MPNSRAPISFIPVELRHYPVLEAWLEVPHMREWWGERDREMGFIRDMVEGRDTTRPFIILLDDRPVGYIQYWFVGHHQNDEWLDDNPWLKELPADAVGVDLSIGEADLLSKGIGSAALAAFVEKLRADGFETILIDPDNTNARAVRAFTKADFRPVTHLQGRTGDALIMQHEAQADGTTP